MDNHRPGEREQMGQLSNHKGRIPESRIEAWKWVQYYAAAVETIFGGDCPLLWYLIAKGAIIVCWVSAAWEFPRNTIGDANALFMVNWDS